MGKVFIDEGYGHVHIGRNEGSTNVGALRHLPRRAHGRGAADRRAQARQLPVLSPDRRPGGRARGHQVPPPQLRCGANRSASGIRFLERSRRPAPRCRACGEATARRRRRRCCRRCTRCPRPRARSSGRATPCPRAGVRWRNRPNSSGVSATRGPCTASSRASWSRSGRRRRRAPGRRVTPASRPLTRGQSQARRWCRRRRPAPHAAGGGRNPSCSTIGPNVGRSRTTCTFGGAKGAGPLHAFHVEPARGLGGGRELAAVGIQPAAEEEHALAVGGGCSRR